MKKPASVLAAALCVAVAYAHDGKDHGAPAHGGAALSLITPGEYNSDPAHSYITFSYDHLGFSNPVIGFKTAQIRVNIDPVSIATLAVDGIIEAGSIESFVPALNDHLTSPAFFDVANHPQIRFSATSGELIDDASGVLNGVLEIKGIVKPVRLDVVLNKVAVNPITKKETLGVSASGTIKRSDWGLDGYAPAVSDTLAVRLELELQKSDDT